MTDQPLVELDFRDGKRLVSAYIANLLAPVETYRLTYEEAMAAANKKIEEDFINAQQDRVLAAHFQEPR